MAGPVVFIITGGRAEGKSSLAISLASILESRSFTVGGVIARGRWKDGRRSGFDLVVPGNHNPVPLADALCPGTNGSRDVADSGSPPVTAGRFIFNPAALAMGNSAIDDAIKEELDLIILDEVGAAEIEGRIWAVALRRLLGEYSGVLLLITARKNLTAVLSHFGIGPAGIFCTGSTTSEEAAAALTSHINKSGKNGTG